MTDEPTIHVTTFRIRGHGYACAYVDRRDLFRAMGRWAADPEIDFGWDDYLDVMFKLRKAECEGVAL